MIKLLTVFVLVILVLEVSLPSLARSSSRVTTLKNVNFDSTKQKFLPKTAQSSGVINIDRVKPALLTIIKEALKSPKSNPKFDMRTKLILHNLAYYD